MSKKIALLIFSTIISLLVLELLARIISLDKLEDHSVFIQYQIYPEEVRFRPSKITGFEFIPNCIPAVNSLGFYDKEYEIKKRKDTYRIVVLGDSITAYDKYPLYLEDRLNNDYNSELSFEVWNCAIPGINIRQYANYLKYKAINYNSDMVLIGLCLSDFEMWSSVIYKNGNNLIEYSSDFPRLGRRFLNDFLFRHSNLYRFIMPRLETIIHSRLIVSTDYHSKEEGLYYLKQIKDLTSKNKIKLVCVIFPYLKELKNYTPFQKEEYMIMKDVLEELNIDYLDLHDVFSDYNLAEFIATENDFTHPNEKGHRVATEAIFEYLKNKYLDHKI